MAGNNRVKILTVNAGSSSVRLEVFDIGDGDAALAG